MESNNEVDYGMLDKLLDELKGLVDQLDDSQKKDLFELISDSDKYGNLINSNYLDKNLPDYKAMAKPLAGWLLPLWRFQSDNYCLLKDILESISKTVINKDVSSITIDLKNYAFCLIADFDQNQRQYVCRLWGLFWLIETLGVDNGIEIVFILLRQNYFFIKEYLADDNSIPVQATLCHLGQNHVSSLYDFLISTGIIPESKIPVLSALAVIASHESPNRMEALNYLLKYLNHIYETGMKGDNMENMEEYVYCLAKNKLEETKPILKKIYDQCNFVHYMIKDYKDVEELMSENVSDALHFYSMTGYLEYLCRQIIADTIDTIA